MKKTRIKLAIFDFDGTMIKEESLPLMVKYWGTLGYSKTKKCKLLTKILKDLIVYKSKLNKNYKKQEFRTSAMMHFLELFEGMSQDEINDYFYKCFEIMKDLFLESILLELNSYRQQGYTTVILSGGFKPYIDIVGKHFGFDYIIASQLNFGADNMLDYNNPVHVNMGRSKADQIRNIFKECEIDWEESIALADSYYDIDIFEMVGTPIVVNPDDRLKEIAMDREWRII